MSQITKITNNSKLEDIRKRAHAAFIKGDFEQTLQTIAKADASNDDWELIHLKGRAAFQLKDYWLAKVCLEQAFATQPKNEDILKDLFYLYDALHEYRKVLHFANLLFGFQADHTEQILFVLRLYRRLGLYGRALELFESLEEGGYHSEPFQQEKAALYLETSDYEQLQRLLINSPLGLDLEKRIKREIRLGTGKDTGWNLKSLYYRQHGKILLGSYSDDGASADIYDDFYFDEDHFYETCLRFVDLVTSSQISYASISPANPLESTIPRVLSKILNLPYKQTPPSSTVNGPHLIVHSSAFEPLNHVDSNNFHHLSFSFSFSETPENLLPEYIGVVLTGPSPLFFFDHRAQNAEVLAAQIFEFMRSKLHISTQGNRGRTYFSILPEFVLSKSNVIRLPFSSAADTKVEKLFLQVEQSLRSDGPLYLNSLLEKLKGQNLTGKQVQTLLSFHKEWDFIPCSIAGFCAFHDLDQTFNFYEREWKLVGGNQELLVALAQIPHTQITNLLIPLLDRNAPLHDFFIDSGAWILLQYNSQFSLWMEEILDHPNFMAIGLEYLGLLDCWSGKWITRLKKLMPRLEPDHFDKVLRLFDSFQVSFTKTELIELANEVKKPTLEFLQNLSRAEIEFPPHLEKWLEDNYKEPLFAKVLDLFSLPNIFSKAWVLQTMKPKELQFIFGSLTAVEYQGTALEMMDIYPKACEELKVEILSYFFQNNLNIEFCFSEVSRSLIFKEALRSSIIQFLESHNKSFEDKDLLYLMEGDELERFRCARYFLGNSDMEFYPYLIHKLKTHGLLFGAEGFVTLFELRSDHALKVLVEYGLAEDGCSPRQIFSFLSWICEDSFRLDEWMLLLGSLELSSQKEILQQWMQKHMESIPAILTLYVRFFPDDCIRETIKYYWNSYSDLTEKFQILRSLDPALLTSFYKSVHPNHFQFHALETLCVQQPN